MIQVGVLHGANGTFCSGYDLKALGKAGAAAAAARLRPMGKGHGPMGPTRMALSKPCIAAVEGHAVAGGLEMALLCDLRVVARSATFGVFCRRFGVPLIDGGTVRLPRLIGLSRAMDLMLTGAWGLGGSVVGGSMMRQPLCPTLIGEGGHCTLFALGRTSGGSGGGASDGSGQPGGRRWEGEAHLASR
jgi:enoyl-CoA hydratase